MLRTLYELFAAFAHRTVELFIQGKTLEGRNVFQALLSRFPNRLEGDPATQMAVGQLYQETSAAMDAARRISRGQHVSPGEYGVNPALRTPYSYTVIAFVEDPMNPDHELSIPWTIASNHPLTGDDIQVQAVAELSAFTGTRDSLPGAVGDDLKRRDKRFREVVQDFQEGSFIGDILILSAYAAEAEQQPLP